MNNLSKLIAACAFVGHAYAQNLVSVEAFDEQSNNPSQMTLRLKLINNSSKTLNDVRATYYLPFDKSQTLSVIPYYMDGATTSIDTLGDYLAVNINVAKLAPGVFPNNGGVSIGMNYANYSSFDKSTHHSYPNSTNFVVTNNIPVYVNGTNVAGNAPMITESAESKMSVRFVGLQPEATSSMSAWVELENYGTTTVNFNELFLKWSDEDSAGVGDVSLPSGKKLRICQSNTLECPASDANVVISNLKFGLYGEFELVRQNQKIDYVAWGKKGILDPSASYLKTEQNTGYGMQVSYKTGRFFRYIEGVGWNIYRAVEVAKSTEALPDPTPFGIEDGMNLLSDENGTLKLSWIPVKGAKAYSVSVFDNQNQLVFEKDVETAFIDLKLKSGEYHWSVVSIDANGLKEKAGAANTFYYIENISENIDLLSEGWVLGVEPIGARKDTKMIVTAWGNQAEVNGWNRIHTLSENMTDEETWRCWVVGVNMLNRYFGGTLTQDEIKRGATRATQASNLSSHFDFMLGNMGAGDDDMVDAAFNFAFNEVPKKQTGMPSLSVVKNALLDGKPLYVSVQSSENSKHIMVVDGYGVIKNDVTDGKTKYFSKGEVLYHFLNIDNNAGSIWINPNSYTFESYRIVEKPTYVKNRDYRVANDADGDGLVDFDEQVRFVSLDKDHYDSDRDGVLDYQEFLLTSKIYEPCGTEDVLTQDDADKFLGCYEKLRAAFDVDDDGLPNYFDSDSDNGGESDGNEVKAGRNPFDSEDDKPLPVVDRILDLPEDITIYSLDEMRVNDRTICYDGDGYCKIASESGRENFSVNIGVQSVVGDIYSKGTVWLRTLSEVKGNIYLYTPEGTSHTVNIQGDRVVFDGKIYRSSFDQWTFDAWDPTKVFSSFGDFDGELVVTAGQEKNLSNGDMYARIKVESGAILNIESGAMAAGTIQFEPGSVINFTNPGEETILYTEGKILWKTKIANEDQELVAKGFKLVQTSDKETFIEGDWAGTIFAPKSDLVMGQTKKLMYGRFLGKAVTMHQNSRIYRVDFNPIDPYSTIVMK
ncbi:MAG: hypothetical protein MJZ05_13880 [Fibrobacter sp.]|nr:hypothetical protein [Fibrobacter sp.]